MLEWAERHDGLYTVADQSTPDLQRRYFAEAVAQRLLIFAEVEYRDWRSLFARLAREAKLAGWHGPLILDELPYLVLVSPELPSILQRWIDHEARDARLTVAIAGSSQRMMQGLVLAGNAPLFGRALEILDLQPLSPRVKELHKLAERVLCRWNLLNSHSLFLPRASAASAASISASDLPISWSTPK